MNQIWKRILIVLASLIFLVYIGFQVYNIFAGELQTETVELSVGYQTVETTGMVFRKETVLNQDAKGYLFYTVENGGRVAKSGTIALVFPSEEDAMAKQESDRLTEEIDTLVSINAQGTTNRANLSTINRQIRVEWLSLTREGQSAILSDVDSAGRRLLTLINKKQLTIGKEENFDARIAELKKEKQKLSSYKQATSAITSPVAGYFISRLDGYESLLGTKGIADLSVDQLQKLFDTQPPAATASLGKIVGDYEWYMACIVPLQSVASLKQGMNIEIRLPFVQSEAVPMTVTAINKGANDTAVLVLQCMNMSQNLSIIRNEQVEIRLKAYEGLRVPDESIRFNEKQEPGVYIRKGNYLEFRKIRVVYHDDEQKYSICALTEGKEYLQLYDKLVLRGDNLYEGKLVR